MNRIRQMVSHMGVLFCLHENGDVSVLEFMGGDATQKLIIKGPEPVNQGLPAPSLPPAKTIPHVPEFVEGAGTQP